MDGRNDDDVAVVFVFVDVAEKLMTMFHPRNKQNCVYGKPKIKKRKKKPCSTYRQNTIGQ